MLYVMVTYLELTQMLAVETLYVCPCVSDGSSSASAFNACSRRYRAAVDEHDEAEEALSSAKADNERLKEEIVRKTEAKDKLLAKIEATKEAARQMQSAIAKKSDVRDAAN